MNLYLDASALVKRYVEEEGSDLIEHAMRGAETLISSRVGFVETLLAIRRKAGPVGVKAARRDWESFELVDVDQLLCNRAAELGMKHGLRTLDALHLASASVVSFTPLTLASWDRRLRAAAAAQGLELLPAALP